MQSLSLSRRLVLAATLAAAFAPAAQAAPTINAPAPPFSQTDQNGQTRSLSDFAGKTVVLEWTSDACPYSHKHYDSGNMQRLQAKARRDGVVWLTVITDAPGTSGYMNPEQVRAWMKKVRSHATAVLLDPDARVARAYEAKTTPHMFIIDRTGKLVYMGGIDDRPYTDPASLKGAKNYVALALADLKANRPIAQAVTRPYGCSVKYAP